MAADDLQRLALAAPVGALHDGFGRRSNRFVADQAWRQRGVENGWIQAGSQARRCSFFLLQVAFGFRWVKLHIYPNDSVGTRTQK